MHPTSASSPRQRVTGKVWQKPSLLLLPATREESRDGEALQQGGDDEHIGCGSRRRIDQFWRERADQTKRRRGERIGRLCHPDDECNRAGDIVLDELDLGNQWRQRRGIAEAESEQDDSCEQQRDRRREVEHMNEPIN